MTKLLDRAILKLRELPAERQDELAEVILDLAAQRRYGLSDEQLSQVESAVGEAERGEFATETQLAQLWKKFGL
jgi:hypothetical protein